MTQIQKKGELPDDRLAFGIDELARAWGVSRDTIVRMVADGELEKVRARSRVLIPRTSVDKFLAGHR